MAKARQRAAAAAAETESIEQAPVRIGGPSVAYVRWSDLKRSDAARRQVRAARALARRAGHRGG